MFSSSCSRRWIKEVEICRGLGGEFYRFYRLKLQHSHTGTYPPLLMLSSCVLLTPLSLHRFPPKKGSATQGSTFLRFQGQGWPFCTSICSISFGQSPAKVGSIPHLLQASGKGARSHLSPAPAMFLLPATSLPVSWRHRQGKKAAALLPVAPMLPGLVVAAMALQAGAASTHDPVAPAVAQFVSQEGRARDA